MEVSLVPILVLDPDVSGEVHHGLQTNRANLLDPLMDRLNVRLQRLVGGELSPALTALVTDWFLMVGLPVSLLVLFGGKVFFTNLALEPGGLVGGLLFRIAEQNVNTASLQETGILSIEIYNTFYVLQIG